MKTELKIGMTTCPRGKSYIRESICSLLDNGWPAPLIYSDDDMRGDLWGFVSVCRMLLSAYPECQNFLVVQDDVVACFRPDGEPVESSWCRSDGVYSLFSTKKDRGGSGAFYRQNTDTEIERKINCDGGIAYLLNRNTMGMVVSFPWERWTPVPQMLGLMCHTKNIPYLIYDIDVFEHIGEHSALPKLLGYKWDVSTADPFRKKP